MKISATANRTIDGRAALKMLREAGFDGVDFSLFAYANWNYVTTRETSGLVHRPKSEVLDYFRSIKEYADSIGLEIAQMHAPFPCYRENNPELLPYAIDLSKTSIRICAEMDCRHIVIHPAFPQGHYDGKPDKIEETLELNRHFYGELIPLLKETGVVLAIENMWGEDPDTKKIIPAVCSHAGEHAEYVDYFNNLAGSECFCACFDVGHANLTGDDPAEVIRTLGDRLKVVHIHDTDGKSDLHTYPFMGSVDWEKVCAAFSEIGYDGYVNLECASFFNGFADELYAQGLGLSAQIARFLAKNIQPE